MTLQVMWFMCLDFLAKIEKRKGGKELFYWALSWNCFICTVKIWRKTFLEYKGIVFQGSQWEGMD